MDFGPMAMIVDTKSGRRQVVHALTLTAVHSRHMCGWLTFSQTLDAILTATRAAPGFLHVLSLAQTVCDRPYHLA
jgi:hypothetical protein